MSDARALLKAKLAQTRITHPYASYTPTGQLRCTVCATSVKHWEGHLGSKGHRTSVARAKEEAERRREEEEEAARRREAEEEQVGEKRRAGDVEQDDEDEEDNGDARAKRRRTSPPEAEPVSHGGFPSDFFSDPTRTLPSRDEDEGEGEDQEMADASTSAPAPSTELDSEWAAFQATVLAPSSTAQPDDPRRDAYERATVFAEPQLVAPSSFPQLEEGGGGPEPEPEMTEAERAEVERKRKEEDERELIMDRLVEEERAQEEADGRVSALRNRLERAKRERAARRAAKAS